MKEEKSAERKKDHVTGGESRRLERRGWRGRTEHADLARQAAGGQRRLSVVEVVCADVVPQVGGATGHPEGRGAEEARAE